MWHHLNSSSAEGSFFFFFYKENFNMWGGKCSSAVFGANFQITLHCLNYLEDELSHPVLIACDIFMRCLFFPCRGTICCWGKQKVWKWQHENRFLIVHTVRSQRIPFNPLQLQVLGQKDGNGLTEDLMESSCWLKEIHEIMWQTSQ